MSSRRAFTGLIATAMLAAACAGTDSESDATLPPAPPASTTTTSAPPSPTTTTTTTATTTTTTTLPTEFRPVIPARGLRYEWVLHTAYSASSGIYGDGHAPVVDVAPPLIAGLKTIADDGAGGLVYLDTEFNLWWVRAGVLYPILVREEFGPFIGVAPGTSTLVFMGEDNPAYLDLFSGAPAAAPPPDADPRAAGGFETPLIRAAQGRTASIEYPDSEADNEGQPELGPATLVIAGAEGADLLRLVVGTEAEPFATIHDFDGRRVLISRGPLLRDPTPTPATIFVLDLECPECTRVGFADGPSADLMGTLQIDSGEVLEPILDPCPGLDTDAALPETELPAAVDETRRRLFSAAAACDFAALQELTGSAFTPVVGHAAIRPGWRGAASAHPSLAADIVTGLGGQLRLTADGDYRWPGWVGHPWSDLTADEQAALEAEFGDGCTEFDSFEECYAASADDFAFSAFVITIEPSGLLGYVGIPLS